MTTGTHTLIIRFILFLSGICSMAQAFAQDSTASKSIIYTFMVNKVPDRFPAPLIGFINIADGNQTGAQVGFLNQNRKNFNGVQTGFVNNIGGACTGGQIGFANLTKDSVNGTQVGFVNLCGSYVTGLQTGFVNICRDSITGAQIGFVNLPGDKVRGTQVGFVNTALRTIEGAQIGFVNTSKDSLNGTQIGFVNTAGQGLKGAQIGFVNFSPRSVTGSQIGFVNVADSIGDGVPMGFVSVVKKGGFQAFEMGYTNLYPANLSYKIGVKKLYTTLSLAYNATYANSFAYGAGLGSIFELNKTFAFNPEATVQSSIERNPQMFTALASRFSLKLSPVVSLVAGPTVTWIHKGSVRNPELYQPGYSLYDYSFDKRNSLDIGIQASLRFSIR